MCTIGRLTQNIHEVQDIQRHPFTHVCCRASAGSVHQKLDWKGRARTHPLQHIPVPQGRPFSILHIVIGGHNLSLKFSILMLGVGMPLTFAMP